MDIIDTYCTHRNTTHLPRLVMFPICFIHIFDEDHFTRIMLAGPVRMGWSVYDNDCSSCCPTPSMYTPYVYLKNTTYRRVCVYS